MSKDDEQSLVEELASQLAWDVSGSRSVWAKHVEGARGLLPFIERERAAARREGIEEAATVAATYYGSEAAMIAKRLRALGEKP